MFTLPLRLSAVHLSGNLPYFNKPTGLQRLRIIIRFAACKSDITLIADRFYLSDKAEIVAPQTKKMIAVGRLRT